MQTKEKLKRFRHTDSCDINYTDEENLPPPYSEIPPFNPFYNGLAHTQHKRSSSNAFISVDESKKVNSQTQALTPSTHAQPNPANTSRSTNYACMYPDLTVSYQAPGITQDIPVDL